jgi:hypothetical protein
MDCLVGSCRFELETETRFPFGFRFFFQGLLQPLKH